MRSGHLFQGRFKAILIEADAYAAELSRYIHLNPVREVPALRQLISRPAPEAILRAVEASFADNEKLARQAGMCLCHRYSGEKVRAIGALYGVGPSAITEASRNFVTRMAKDQELAGIVEKIKAELRI